MVEIKNIGGINYIDKFGCIYCDRCGIVHLKGKCPECNNKENLNVY